MEAVNIFLSTHQSNFRAIENIADKNIVISLEVLISEVSVSCDEILMASFTAEIIPALAD